MSAETLGPLVEQRWVSPVLPWGACSPERRETLRMAWQLGELSYKLTPSQQAAHRKILQWKRKPKTSRKYLLDSSRRWGKSALLCVLALEMAIKNPGWRIVYCAPEYKMVLKILLPLMAQMLIDCPPELNAGDWWMKSEGTFYLPNGSKIELVGLDVNPDGARGTHVDLVLLDEAGFYDNLEYLLSSILFPQMLGRAHARIVAGSTPPVSPSHYWSSVLVPNAILEGAHDKRTLPEADQYTKEEIEFFIEEAGGRKSTTCRREYFAEHVTDATMAIIPEFRDVEDFVVCKVDPPPWRDCYVSMDPGWKDLTALLFGYWHFEKQALVIEDELAAPRLNSKDIAEAMKRKELVLWHGLKLKKSGNAFGEQPYRRVSDRDHRLVQDLWTEHKLLFQMTAKDDLDQQINAVRVMFSKQKILIHPRCKMTIQHLKNGVWKNEARKVFAREGGDLGHFDLIAALVYLVRNIDKWRNPAPKVERYVAGDIKVAPKPASRWQHGQRTLRSGGSGQELRFKTK
jgi:hypothetical protein